MTYIATFASGLLFALGLGVSGMTQPQKVTDFLNVAGRWDPSLILVLVAAAGVYLAAYLVIRKRSRPLFRGSFTLPTRSSIDRPLVMGSALFGLGWGLVGFCPGPALVSLASGGEPAVIFVLAMAVGMYAFEVLDVRFSTEPDGGAGLIGRTWPSS